jgi:hypothetical protein
MIAPHSAAVDQSIDGAKIGCDEAALSAARDASAVDHDGAAIMDAMMFETRAENSLLRRRR